MFAYQYFTRLEFRLQAASFATVGLPDRLKAELRTKRPIFCQKTI
jgi:hypothetical protein